MLDAASYAFPIQLVRGQEPECDPGWDGGGGAARLGGPLLLASTLEPL